MQQNRGTGFGSGTGGFGKNSGEMMPFADDYKSTWNPKVAAKKAEQIARAQNNADVINPNIDSSNNDSSNDKSRKPETPEEKTARRNEEKKEKDRAHEIVYGDDQSANKKGALALAKVLQRHNDRLQQSLEQEQAQQPAQDQASQPESVLPAQESSKRDTPKVVQENLARRQKITSPEESKTPEQLARKRELIGQVMILAGVRPDEIDYIAQITEETDEVIIRKFESDWVSTKDEADFQQTQAEKEQEYRDARKRQIIRQKLQKFQNLSIEKLESMARNGARKQQKKVEEALDYLFDDRESAEGLNKPEKDTEEYREQLALFGEVFNLVDLSRLEEARAEGKEEHGRVLKERLEKQLRRSGVDADSLPEISSIDNLTDLQTLLKKTRLIKRSAYAGEHAKNAIVQAMGGTSADSSEIQVSDLSSDTRTTREQIEDLMVHMSKEGWQQSSLDRFLDAFLVSSRGAIGSNSGEFNLQERPGKEPITKKFFVELVNERPNDLVEAILKSKDSLQKVGMSVPDTYFGDPLRDVSKSTDTNLVKANLKLVLHYLVTQMYKTTEGAAIFSVFSGETMGYLSKQKGMVLSGEEGRQILKILEKEKDTPFQDRNHLKLWEDDFPTKPLQQS